MLSDDELKEKLKAFNDDPTNLNDEMTERLVEKLVSVIQELKEKPDWPNS